jgi:hypothetical protein
MFMQRQVVMRVGLTRRMLSPSANATFSTAEAAPAPKPEEVIATESKSKSKPNPPTADGKRLRMVVAVGGNALQRRGERLTIENMLKAAAEMAPTMADLCSKHELGKIRYTECRCRRRNVVFRYCCQWSGLVSRIFCLFIIIIIIIIQS